MNATTTTKRCSTRLEPCCFDPWGIRNKDRGGKSKKVVMNSGRKLIPLKLHQRTANSRTSVQAWRLVWSTRRHGILGMVLCLGCVKMVHRIEFLGMICWSIRKRWKMYRMICPGDVVCTLPRSNEGEATEESTRQREALRIEDWGPKIEDFQGLAKELLVVPPTKEMIWRRNFYPSMRQRNI